MMIVSRCLERIGDHAVDIGEQTAYLVTGEFREFTDANLTGSRRHSGLSPLTTSPLATSTFSSARAIRSPPAARLPLKLGTREGGNE